MPVPIPIRWRSHRHFLLELKIDGKALFFFFFFFGVSPPQKERSTGYLFQSSTASHQPRVIYGNFAKGLLLQLQQFFLNLRLWLRFICSSRHGTNSYLYYYSISKEGDFEVLCPFYMVRRCLIIVLQEPNWTRLGSLGVETNVSLNWDLTDSPSTNMKFHSPG